jgi:hypothetical protein
MISKRLGMVLAAVFVLWSLAGTGWFAPGSSDWNTQVSGVSLAFAGDPDSYEDANDSDSNPGPDPDPESGSPPPSQDEETVSRDSDAVQTVLFFVSLIFRGMP